MPCLRRLELKLFLKTWHFNCDPLKRSKNFELDPI